MKVACSSDHCNSVPTVGLAVAEEWTSWSARLSSGRAEGRPDHLRRPSRHPAPCDGRRSSSSSCRRRAPTGRPPSERARRRRAAAWPASAAGRAGGRSSTPAARRVRAHRAVDRVTAPRRGTVGVEAEDVAGPAALVVDAGEAGQVPGRPPRRRQRCDRVRIERDRSDRAGLGRPIADRAGQREVAALDDQAAVLEVDVAPTQPARLGAAHPGRRHAPGRTGRTSGRARRRLR